VPTSIRSDDGLVLLTPHAFEPVLAAALRSARGRPPKTFSEWLQSEVWLPADGGPHAGKRFRFEYQPISRLWAAEIDSGRWNEFVYSGPSQSGKSLIGYVLPFCWHVTEHNESVGFAVPMEEMAADKWAADVRPVLTASAKMRAALPRSGPGSAGGSIRDRIQFANGPIAKILTAGGSDQAKAGFTCRVVVLTEAARFSRGSERSPEAAPIDQIRARQRAFRFIDRRTYIEGTKTLASELPATLWDASSQTRIVAPCPHCGAWICPGREALQGWHGCRTEIEAYEKTSWFCPSCGESITDDQRRDALGSAKLLHGGQTITKSGRVDGEPPNTRRLFFEYSAWHNLFLTANDLGVDLWAADQLEPGSVARELAERKTCQFVFGNVYTPPPEYAGEVLTESDFDGRGTPLPRGIAPADTAHLVLGCDVGEYVCHWVCLAVRPASLHVVDYGTATVARDRPLRDALTDALADLFSAMAAGFAVDQGDRLPVRSAYVDSGYLPEVVFAACKRANAAAARNWVLPVLGRGETQLSKRRYAAPTRTGNVVRRVDPDRRWHLSRVPKAKIDQLTVDADNYKQLSDAGFRTPAGEPGAITLFAAPAAAHRVFIRHQINEQFVTEELPDTPTKSRWICTGANHYKDALAYAICAAARLGWSQVAAPPPKPSPAAGYE
jgi:phage terminase large subunit GpA-like protein